MPDATADYINSLLGAKPPVPLAPQANPMAAVPPAPAVPSPIPTDTSGMSVTPAQPVNPLAAQAPVAPKPLTTKQRVLGALFTGMGAFKSPQLGQSIEHEIFEQPEENYEKQRAQYENEEERQQEDIERQKGEESEAALRTAQGNEANARAKALENPPAKPQKLVPKLIADPNDATAPIAASFDPASGKYLDESGNEIQNARGWVKPTNEPTIGKLPPEIEAQIGEPPDPKSYKQGRDDPQYKKDLSSWGKKAEGLKNQEAGAAGEARFLPLLESRTQNLIDPDTGLPTDFQWDPKTHSYTRKVGVSATGAYGHEMAQAGAVERGGEQLITDLQDNRDQLGTLSAWVKKYGLNTPIADPKLAGLQAELSTFAALQPAMHGFRSHSALETFNSIIGGLQKNPDATIASIRGILKTAGNINPQLKNETKESGGAFKVGDSITQNGHTFRVTKVDRDGKVLAAQ